QDHRRCDECRREACAVARGETERHDAADHAEWRRRGDFNRRTGNRLVPVVPVHIEPFGLYSSSIPDLGAIPDYAEVALPSDAVNVDRSLMMLDRLGLIECAPARRSLATVGDVRANPRRLVFKELTS